TTLLLVNELYRRRPYSLIVLHCLRSSNTLILLPFLSFFFFTDPATPEIYTLSLHDALPISAKALGKEFKPLAVSDDADFESEFADRKSTRLNSSHVSISYAVFCLKKKIHKIGTV